MEAAELLTIRSRALARLECRDLVLERRQLRLERRQLPLERPVLVGEEVVRVLGAREDLAHHAIERGVRAKAGLDAPEQPMRVPHLAARCVLNAKVVEQGARVWRPEER